MQLSERQLNILNSVALQPGISISKIKVLLAHAVSIPTLNRDIAELVSEEFLIKSGDGRNTNYSVSPKYKVLYQIPANSYFEKETDDRGGNFSFQYELFDILKKLTLFEKNEIVHLNELHKFYKQKIKNISPTLLKKETERLTTELSWKSSQIEGNTYSLLETDLLFSEKILAKNKEKSEAVMLLNHKTALDFIYRKKIKVLPLKVNAIVDIHSLLIKDLGVSKNIRKRSVGITGSSYLPPENEFLIKEFLEKTCSVINSKKSIFEKSLLCTLLISYIQPFEDGNKRTGRITANALLIENGYCPLSYRSVNSMDYKKTMILFYEQNNILAYKKLFMEQYEFAVKNYF